MSNPAPLPMYERIVLKHVPTMLRRRYDDSHFQDLPSKDSRSEDDGDVNPVFASNADDGADYEAEDVTQLEDDTHVNCYANYDTQMCTEHLRLSASMNSTDTTSTDEVAEDVIPANSNIGHTISENNAQDISCLQDWGNEDADVVNYEDSSAKTELQSNAYGLNVKDCRWEGDGTKEANIARYSVDDSVERGDSDNEVENTMTMKSFGNDAKKVNCPAPLPMYQRVTLKHVPTMVRRRYDKDLHKFNAAEGLASEESSESKGHGTEYANPASTLSEVDHNTENQTQTEDVLANFYAEQDTQTYTEDFRSNDFTLSADMYAEDGKSEVYEAEEVNLASSVDDSGKGTIHDHGHESDSDQDSCSEDCADEDDEAKNANVKNYVDANFNELGLNRYCDGTKDAANVDSYYVDDSAEDEVHSERHGGFDNHQGLQTVHCKSRDDGTKEDDAATYYQDRCVEDDVQEKEYVNFEDEQDLHLQDSKSQGKGADVDENPATFGNASVKMEVPDKGLENSYCEHDFDPEAYKKTLERDGYDLCCPNCQRCVTKTMIFRRKEISKQQGTTCFSFLIALFRCIR